MVTPIFGTIDTAEWIFFFFFFFWLVGDKQNKGHILSLFLSLSLSFQLAYDSLTRLFNWLNVRKGSKKRREKRERDGVKREREGCVGV